MNLRRRGGKRKGFTAEQRARLVEAFEGREGTTAEFARRHGVGVSTLHQWVRRAQAGRRTGQTRRLKFQEMVVRPMASAAWAGEVQLPDGTQLRWNNQADLNAVGELLSYLRLPC